MKKKNQEKDIRNLQCPETSRKLGGVLGFFVSPDQLTMPSVQLYNSKFNNVHAYCAAVTIGRLIIFIPAVLISAL